ncbi:MAG: CHAT domain-containing protein [Bacteroidia bacterium]|nr:CHAT domain-containing protein [Bacteroidia bacterium]
MLRRRRLSSRSAVVIGNPAFDRVAQPDTSARTRQLFGINVAPLPGAEQEAKEIASILGVSPILGDSATEEKVKSLISPKVLHIATHGYFMEGEGPAYLRSGLLLAGAAVWNEFYPPPGVEDGRLTAREVSAMNLWGTQLVVLSACETGLGDITGEGLYGLQRAFLEAGALAVIATLWPIDDTATKELMTRFYQNWLKAGEKAEIETVFAEKLKDFRRRYREPYYWGAFVLMR